MTVIPTVSTASDHPNAAGSSHRLLGERSAREEWLIRIWPPEHHDHCGKVRERYHQRSDLLIELRFAGRAHDDVLQEVADGGNSAQYHHLDRRRGNQEQRKNLVPRPGLRHTRERYDHSRVRPPPSCE